METISFSNGPFKATTYGKPERPSAEGVELTSFSYGKGPFHILHHDEVPFFFHYGNKLMGGAKIDKKEALSKSLCENMGKLIKEKSLDPKKITCYIAPCASFTHVEIDRKKQEELIKEGYRFACKRTTGVDYLDLPLFCVLMLRKVGIPMKNIYVSDYGTADDGEILFSASRGEKENNLTVASISE